MYVCNCGMKTRDDDGDDDNTMIMITRELHT